MDKQLADLTPRVFARDDGELATTSLNVAAVFGRRHDKVVRDINIILPHYSDLRDGAKSSTSGWFEPVEYLDGNGRARPSFSLTRNGFTALVINWTGPKARAFTIRYFEAFDRMEQVLRLQATPASLHDLRALHELLLDHDDKLIALGAKVDGLASARRWGPFACRLAAGAAKFIGSRVPTLQWHRQKGTAPALIRLSARRLVYRCTGLRAWIESRRIGRGNA